MEVRGSVIVSDIDAKGETKTTVLKAGFADLDRQLEPHEKDNVPRILVKNFKRNTKPYNLYLVFHKFGTVTYLAVDEQQAVIEFSKKNPVIEVMKCTFLKVESSCVVVEQLGRFLHCEPDQFEIEMHEDLGYLNSAVAFDNYIEHIDKLAAAESKPEIERVICKKLESITRKVYRDCKAYVFGSRMTQLGLTGCDLDIFFDCGNMYHGEFDQMKKEQQMIGEAVLHEMVRSSDFDHIYKVWHARVPILKFFHVPSATYGDIAFRSGLGVENTKLVNFLQSVDKRVHFLFLFVKKWASLQTLRKATELCHFSSYSLVMMATYYLQQLNEPILPPICKLMELHRGEQTVISGWPCSFTRDRKNVPRTKNKSTLLELTKGFFKFYQYFHFEWKVICPLLGKTLEKQEMKNIQDPESEISPIFAAYIDHLQAEGERFKLNSNVCVQDPFELSHNLTRGVKEEVLMRFVSSCGLIYEKLSSLH